MARTGNLSARGKRRRRVGRSWRVASWNVRSLVESEGPIATGAVTGKVAEDKNSSCYSTSLPPEDWRRSVAGDVVVRYGFLRGGWQFGLGLWSPCPG